MKLLALVLLPTLAGWAGTAHAQTDVGWNADLGAVMRVRPDYLGSKHYAVDAVPVIEAHLGDQLQLSLDDGAKWSALRSVNWAFGPVAEYRQSYSDHLPAGAHRLDDAVELGGFGSHRLPLGEVELRLRHAVNGYQGWSGDLSFDTGGQVTPNWKVGGQARLAWADSAFSDAYFGLRREATRRLGLPRFAENDFRTVGLELDAARRLSPRTQLVLSLAEDRILGKLGDTPILCSRDLATLSIGLTYHWGAGPP
jgi:outer membrane scaffolding protein for murein synthesis (MipA/OmpV family)